jgi:hypothetical protein
VSCSSFVIRAGDELPVLRGRATYRDAAGVVKPFSFTGWTGLTFLATATGLAPITGPATGDADGLLSYQWNPADTDIAGTYEGKFFGNDPDGYQQTFPTKGFITIEITP